MATFYFGPPLYLGSFTPSSTTGSVISPMRSPGWRRLADAAGAPAASQGAHSLALLSDGSVIAWGRNSAGQCNVPAGLTGAIAIAAGATAAT